MKRLRKILICAGLLLTIVALAIAILVPKAIRGTKKSEYISIKENIESLSPKAPNPHQEVREILNNLDFGSIAFNSPSSINIEDTQEIHLALDMQKTVGELKKAIIEKGRKIGATIKVSNRMKAHLSGYKFDITAITPEVQAIPKDRKTEWRWEVTPKKEGRHKLYLSLSGLLEIDGADTPRSFKTFSKVIEVQVTRIQRVQLFFNNNWQWLWTVFLVPIVGFLWSRKSLNY